MIITIKDYRGNCIAQNISSPILITDDHKTSGLQNESKDPPSTDESFLPGRSILPPAPSSNTGPAPQLFNLGQSRSTSNFSTVTPFHNTPNLQRSSTSVQLHRHNPLQAFRSTGLTTPSYNPSYRTSATLTPHHLSRQVSPSATSGPAPKRRKASGSIRMEHRPLVDLSMTRMETEEAAPHHEHSASASPNSSSGASEGLSMGKSISHS